MSRHFPINVPVSANGLALELLLLGVSYDAAAASPSPSSRTPDEHSPVGTAQETAS